MDDGVERGELARLRERAYGAHADIDGDQVALARLRELEAAASPDTPVTAARVAPEADPDASATHAAPPSAGEPARRRRWPVAVAWAASLVVVSVVASVTTAWLVDEDDQHYAVLRPVAEASVTLAGQNLYTRDLQQYEDFLGVTVASSFVDGKPCLMVWPDAQANPGAFRLQCTGIGLEPTATLALDPAAAVPASAAAIAELSAGATLRFTLIDGAVAVDVGRP